MMDIDFNFDDDKIKKSLNDLSDAISNFKKNVNGLSKHFKDMSKIIKDLKSEDTTNKITKKTLIIPDVHCRDFYVDILDYILQNEPDVNIVFLGDYLDGYEHEWVKDDTNEVICDYQRLGIDRLKNIIEIKKKYYNRITLLLGNHDLTYIFGTKFCKCRTDFINWNEIYELYKNNIDLFDLCYDEFINDIRIIYSHSGIHKIWGQCFMDMFNITKNSEKDEPFNCDEINTRFHQSCKFYYEHDYVESSYFIKNDMVDLLSKISYLRGGYTPYGSIVWGDIRDFTDTYIDEKLTNEAIYNDVIQIVGHTQLLENAISIRGKIFDLDVRQCFYIDDKANVRYYNTDDLVYNSQLHPHK